MLTEETLNVGSILGEIRVRRESETEKEGLREYVKVLERIGYECGQLVRERWKLIALK